MLYKNASYLHIANVTLYNKYENYKMRLKLTKPTKLLICITGLFSFCSILVTTFKTKSREALAADPIEGYYAKAAGDSKLSNITFELEANTAPQDSTKYKTSNGSLKVLRENGTIHTVADSVDAFTKTAEKTYKIATTAFSGVGALNAGDTIILDGNFVRDDCTLHIKESKLYVYTSDSIVTVPHKVTNITSYLDGVRPSQEVQSGHNWAFLIWPSELPFEAMLKTKEDGYYPTSIHNIYVDGVPHANCRYDALRRRDDWGTEIFICAESQIGSNNPEVGTLVVIDGIFNYKNYKDGQYIENPHVALENGESLGIEINLLAFLKVGSGVDDYKKVDFKSYIIEQFSILYNSDLYEPELFEEINTIHSQLKTSIQSLNTAKEIYDAYNLAATQMQSKPLTEDGFDSFKDRYFAELSNYVDLDKYYDADKAIINQYIAECAEALETATSTQQVLNLIALAKAQINSVKTRATKMEEAVLHLSDGYEAFLAPYDNVTLNDLSLGNSAIFHGKKNQRGDDVNTNAEEDNQFNTFAPNSKNKNGNVVFNFKYKANAVPTEQANVVITLRGIKYYGYKFYIGTNSSGYMFKRVFGNLDDSFSGDSYIFTDSNKEYEVSISAIDLIEGNRTWIRLVVDGTELLNKVVDSLSICTNPRVALSNNDSGISDVNGTAVLSNFYPSTDSLLNPLYCGRFGYESGHSRNNQTMFLTMKNNNLSYDASGVDSYALNANNIKLIRDDEEFVIGRSDVPILGKYSDTLYQLYLSKLITDEDEIDTLYPGDIVVISGRFSYFDKDSSEKVIFEVGTSSFVFKGRNRPWTSNTSLEEAKDDATKQFNYYRSEEFQTEYDDEGKQTINNLSEEGINLLTEADTVEKVEKILDRVSSLIDEVQTAFEKYQSKTIALIDSYKKEEYSLYRQEELSTILALKEEFKGVIMKSSSMEEIDQLFAEAKLSIDSVLTDKEMSAKELNEAIYHQLNEIKNRYAALINGSMSQEEIEKLNSETLAAIEKVKAAKTVEEANSAVNSYLNAHPLAKEKNNTTLIIIIAASAAVLLLGASTFTFFIIRKHKKANLEK